MKLRKFLKDLPDDFQLDQLRAALEFVPDFSCALDIGAHRGIWTKEMTRYFTEVHAFEPVQKLYDKIAANGLTCHKYNVACGDKPGYCSIKPGPRNTGQGSVDGGGEIPVVVLDSFLPKVKPDFIKIDVEGFEFNVLRGARNMIMKHKPVIFIEENGLGKKYGHYDDRASALLQRWGMRKRAEFYVPPEPDRNVLFTW